MAVDVPDKMLLTSKSLELLKSMRKNDQESTIGFLAADLNLDPKAVAMRLARAMELGFVERTGHGVYRLNAQGLRITDRGQVHKSNLNERKHFAVYGVYLAMHLIFDLKMTEDATKEKLLLSKVEQILDHFSNHTHKEGAA